MTFLKGFGEQCTADRIRLLAVRDVRGALDQQRLASQDTDPEKRFVACLWSCLPDTPTIIDDVIQRLAETALCLWPEWFGTTLPTGGNFDDLLTTAFLTAANHEFDGSPLMPPWLQASAARCASGRVPVPKGFSNAAQLRQLSLAIAPNGMEVLLCTESVQPPSGALLGLARAAEWIARETDREVTVVVPEPLAGSAELDSISFSTLTVEQASRDLPSWEDIASQESVPQKEIRDSEKAECFVWPIEGRPHPNSPGEQLLAKRLEEDNDLRSLFEFNIKIDTVRGSTILADLVWRSGKVVVEVDGYHWHCSPTSFSNDRNRDYELLISGYLVLRIPHEEIMNNVETAIRKIRDVVRFRCAGLSST